MAYDPAYGGYPHLNTGTGEVTRSDYPSDWPDICAEGGSRAAKHWRAVRAAAWDEQNIPPPGVYNPHRRR